MTDSTFPAAMTAPAVEVEERPMTREQRRSKRKRAVRAKTTSIKRTPKRDLEIERMLYPLEEHPAPMAGGPRTRAECQGAQRPCPYVSCRFHLYLDVNPRTGAIKVNFPDLEPDQMTHSCALDVADAGGATMEEVGAIMNLTRERIRQLEVNGMGQIQSLAESELKDFAEEGPIGKRRLPLYVVPDVEEDEEEFEPAPLWPADAAPSDEDLAHSAAE